MHLRRQFMFRGNNCIITVTMRITHWPYSTESLQGLWAYTGKLCSQNDLLSDFNKCVITRSAIGKSYQINYVTKLSLPTHGIIRLLPDTTNEALKMSGDLVHGRGTWRRSLQIYNRSIALSQPLSEYNTICPFLKWIRMRFQRDSEVTWAADFMCLPKWHILRVMCRVLQSWHNCITLWLDSTAIDDEMGVGVVVSIQRIKHENTKIRISNLIQSRSQIIVDDTGAEVFLCNLTAETLALATRITSMESATMKNHRASSPWTTTEKTQPRSVKSPLYSKTVPCHLKRQETLSHAPLTNCPCKDTSVVHQILTISPCMPREKR